MGRTIAELKATMSLEEFAAWVAYDKIKFIGDERRDVLLGQIGQFVAASCGVDIPLYDVAPWLDDRTDEQKIIDKRKKMKAFMTQFSKRQNSKTKAAPATKATPAPPATTATKRKKAPKARAK